MCAITCAIKRGTKNPTPTRIQGSKLYVTHGCAVSELRITGNDSEASSNHEKIEELSLTIGLRGSLIYTSPRSTTDTKFICRAYAILQRLRSPLGQKVTGARS